MTQSQLGTQFESRHISCKTQSEDVVHCDIFYHQLLLLVVLGTNSFHQLLYFALKWCWISGKGVRSLEVKRFLPYKFKFKCFRFLPFDRNRFPVERTYARRWLRCRSNKALQVTAMRFLFQWSFETFQTVCPIIIHLCNVVWTIPHISAFPTRSICPIRVVE